MATIYRFIVEQGTSRKSGGRKSGENSKKSTAKSTTLLKMLGGGEKGGVEHNRKLRAINPLLNRITAGYWEKGMRLGRAGLGLVKFTKNKQTGKYEATGLSGTAIAIIIALAVTTSMKHHNRLIEKEQRLNTLNYKQLETGQSTIHSAYEASVNIWSGKITYNQNK